ncbi:TetR family transcriptional regulator [Streptomyces sp. A3M-1-3]|uniref:TetR/AcrR family transcriptional regulator n=1 Tax=Streptomyces sp. A3M-1-3 TaxID=2962044 RepID=UPI0020B8823C|nr:TetR/AcrR family transcriptional regulator [Streptomyces sp. A3M-1-3]MCP3822575.1 TetR family transcriptional regulator [Streptomyces sp. A3M-1-3]
MDRVPHAKSFRRTPVQQRSAARLTRILDACAELLDETGYENLSTRAVALRAGVPIGSVYRFFGNKRAMADALAHRNLEHYAQRAAARLEALPRTDWRGAIDAVLDEYIAMKRTVPGFALVDFGVPAPAESAAPADRATESADDADTNGLVAGRLTDLIAAHLGRAADDRLRRTVLVAVEATDALLQLAFRIRPSGDPELIAETRELLHAYLARTLG